MRFITLLTIAFLLQSAILQAQSPYRIFTLDCNLNTESERATSSLVTKAFLIRRPEILKDSKKLKPYAPMDWKAFQMLIDTMQTKVSASGDFSWEEDYGLKTEGPTQERWKELTFYQADFKADASVAEIMKSKRKYLLQLRVNLDLNGQIESIQYIKGKNMKNREPNILHAYKILYKPSKK
ncbi:MAG: hypothetical protein ACOYOA_16180 [Saprospiraceae bacterium]